jgi:hypothetical protein
MIEITVALMLLLCLSLETNGANVHRGRARPKLWKSVYGFLQLAPFLDRKFSLLINTLEKTAFFVGYMACGGVVSSQPYSLSYRRLGSESSAFLHLFLR